MGIRSVLSRVLARLSQWAIKKHGMKLVVISGRHGTKLTGELIGEMLSPEYVVRKQLERPFWDFSVPLSILGFEDRRYSVLGWMWLILRAVVRLTFGPKNSTWTILQVSTYKNEIATYWANIIKPDVLVITTEKDEIGPLEELLIERTKGTVVALRDMLSPQKVRKITSAQYVSVGERGNADVLVHGAYETRSGIEMDVTWKGEEKKRTFRAFQKGSFMKVPMMLAISTLLALDFDAREVSDKLLHAQIEVDRFIFSAQT